ncbi:MAG: hypothetical protein ABEK59_02710 [Halobacteria archaeon]
MSKGSSDGDKNSLSRRRILLGGAASVSSLGIAGCIRNSANEDNAGNNSQVSVNGSTDTGSGKTRIAVIDEDTTQILVKELKPRLKNHGSVEVEVFDVINGDYPKRSNWDDSC